MQFIRELIYAQLYNKQMANNTKFGSVINLYFILTEALVKLKAGNSKG